MQLSKNFTLAEFHCNDEAHTPVPAHAIDDVRELVTRYLQPLRDKFGRVEVLSGYRTEARNREVGGASRSYHKYDLGSERGVAADVRCARGTPAAWAGFLEQLGAGGLGKYPGFVHVDTRRDRARW